MRRTMAIGLCLLAVCNPWAVGDEAGSPRRTLHDVYLDCITDELVPNLLAHESGLGPVAEFGRMLETGLTAHTDALTVDSELYWIALFGVGWADPSIYLVRTCLLMSEGRLEQAANTLCFAVAPALMSDGKGLALINVVWSDLVELFAHYDAIWRQGVSSHDRGQFAEALEHYDRVLAENPANCPALVSKGVTLAVMERKGLSGGSHKEALALWAKARASNPFYAWAYQGTREEAGKGVVVDQVLSSVLGDMRAGNSAAVNLARFAEGCLLVGAPDYALYALWIDVGQKLAAGLPVEEEVRAMVRVLAEKGMNAASRFLSEVMKRLQAASNAVGPKNQANGGFAPAPGGNPAR